MSFSDTAFLFFLVLILFGPKKLPEIARQAGRLLAELRRASNEFRSQIETEISNLELEKSRENRKNEAQKTEIDPGGSSIKGSLSAPIPPMETVAREPQAVSTMTSPTMTSAIDANAASEQSPSAPGETSANPPVSQESHVG
jgi:sec-independent protein translocase protein TatB